MVTSAAIYNVLHFFNITIDIRNVCVFLAPLFSSLTTLITFVLTKELKVTTICTESEQTTTVNVLETLEKNTDSDQVIETLVLFRMLVQVWLRPP